MIRFFSITIIISLLISCVSLKDKEQLLLSGDIGVQEKELVYCSADVDLQKQALNALNTSTKNMVMKNTTTNELNPEKISLLNWNIYKLNGNDWQKDLLSYLQSHDLMTLQEATLNEEFIETIEDSEFGWVMNTAFEFMGTTAGVMNVSNVDALFNCGYKSVEPIVRVPKSTLISYYAVSGYDEYLLVANIHSINFTLGLVSYKEQLEKLYDVISVHDGPVILAGDFNSWSEERLFAVMDLVESLSLSKLECSDNNKTHVFGNAIDHVFYRQLEVVSKEIIQVSSSDHNPISVRFRM